jgi:Secretion system C-terminal sorting domain
MAKNFMLVILVFCIFPSLLLSQTSSRSYGLSDGRVYSFQNISKSEDNGFILAGDASQSVSSFDNVLYVVKTDQNGQLKWQNVYPELPKILQPIVISTQDNSGNFLIMGTTLKDNKNQLFILLVDRSGNKIDVKYLIKPMTNVKLQNLIKTNDGNLIALVYESVYEAGNIEIERNVRLIKLSNDGTIIFDKVYKRMMTSSAIVQSNDNGYILATDTLIGINAAQKGVLFKVDENGNYLWTKPRKSGWSTRALYSLPDNTFAYGSTMNLNNVNELGLDFWQKDVSSAIESKGFTIGGAFLQTIDRKLLIMANVGDNDFRIAKFDVDGSLIHTQKINFSTINMFSYLSSINDTCFHIVGTRDRKAYFATFGNCSSITSSIKENNDLKVNVYPNPIDNESQISMPDLPASTKGIVDLLDVSGRIVASQNFEGNTFMFNKNISLKGFYILKIKTADGKLGNQKIIIQ